jgi:hypothetical protein
MRNQYGFQRFKPQSRWALETSVSGMTTVKLILFARPGRWTTGGDRQIRLFLLFWTNTAQPIAKVDLRVTFFGRDWRFKFSV